MLLQALVVGPCLFGGAALLQRNSQLRCSVQERAHIQYVSASQLQRYTGTESSTSSRAIELRGGVTELAISLQVFRRLTCKERSWSFSLFR